MKENISTKAEPLRIEIEEMENNQFYARVTGNAWTLVPRKTYDKIARIIIEEELV